MKNEKTLAVRILSGDVFFFDGLQVIKLAKKR